MMELDKGLAALFSEQKKKTQAKKDEKSKLQKEKTLVRDFKIKVRCPQLSPQRFSSLNTERRGKAEVVPLPAAGAGPGGGVRGTAGGQPTGPGSGRASARHHRQRDELRQQPAGAGLPPPSGRHLQVTPPWLQVTSSAT